MSIYDNSAAAFGTAQGTLGATVQPGALAQSMNTYMSPYIQKVLNDAVSRHRDSRDEALMGVNSNAYQSGAFGGSRHGLVEARTIDNYGRSEDELVARLLQQGFDTSGQLAATEMGFQQSGANSLAGLGTQQFNVGQQINQGQMQAGTMQQQLLQAILGQGAQDYADYANYPLKQLGTLLSAIQGNPLSGNVTQQYKPGLFDYLSMGAGTYAAGK